MEYTTDSDIDIAIFTKRNAEDFYILVDEISEITFEYNVKYDVLLSPVFQNVDDFEKWKGVLPYYKNIQKEVVNIGTGNVGVA